MNEMTGKGAPGANIRRITFHEAIRKNRRDSVLMMTSVLALSVVTGYAIGRAQGYPLAGIMLFLSILLILVLVAMSGGKDIPIYLNGARKAWMEEERLVHNVLEELKIASGFAHLIEVYIIDSDKINAFASGLSEERAAIAITSGALEKLTRDELQGIVAHELSHILSRDSMYYLLMAVIVGSVTMLCDLFLRIGIFSRRGRYSRGWMIPAVALAIVSPIFLTILRFAVSREREYLADSTAVKITRNPLGLASALKKASSHGFSIEETNRATGHMFILNPRGRQGFAASSIFSTHPSTEERIRRLEMMGAGNY